MCCPVTPICGVCLCKLMIVIYCSCIFRTLSYRYTTWYRSYYAPINVLPCYARLRILPQWQSQVGISTEGLAATRGILKGFQGFQETLIPRVSGNPYLKMCLGLAHVWWRYSNIKHKLKLDLFLLFYNFMCVVEEHDPLGWGHAKFTYTKVYLVDFHHTCT